MESLQQIKNRINSVGSTRQITQSMRLVSTSKVQKARVRMEANRPFLEESQRLMQSSAGLATASLHPYLTGRDVECSAVVVIGGDRGLCGGYNHGVGKETARLMKTLGTVKLVTVGSKARDFCRRRWKKQLERSFVGISETPFHEDAKELAALVLDWYDKGQVDEIHVVYTQFFTMLSQQETSVRLLPITPPSPEEKRDFRESEPGGEAFLSQVTPFYLSAFLYGAILEASACEQSARITSMDAAVKNADEMIEALNLSYNQARQGAITQEIIEIVSGANAV